MMLVASIPVYNVVQADELIVQAKQKADVLELRLDYWEAGDLYAALKKWRDELTIPLLFTLRKTSQGGVYQQDEATRLQTIVHLCELKPDYLDLEYDVPQHFLQQLHSIYPTIKLICSYHHFENTPDDLEVIFKNMQDPAFYAYKIATKVSNTVAALRLLVLVKNNSSQHKLTCIGMGELGQCTRILGGVIGNFFTYASVSANSNTASGQLDLDELINVYRIKNLNADTKIYALLGDPVVHSLGHLLHNQAMCMLQQNAVYVKLMVKETELALALAFCRKLLFAGCSVTMPLKEKIIPYLDTYADEASKEVANSIVMRKGKWIGFNTDGQGAMLVLAERLPLAGARLVILGAGGAAKAIVKAAVLNGAQVIILNKTVSKAISLAQSVGGEAYDLSHLSQLKSRGYHAIINTLPVDFLFSAEDLLQNTIAMDIVYQPVHTVFLQLAQVAGCVCIPGYYMYIEQALLQMKRWFCVEDWQLALVKKWMIDYFSAFK